MHATNYKLTELMVVRCAKEINDNEVVFAGVGLPLVVVSFAMVTHAPNMILFTEGGSIRATAPPGLAITVDDPALFCDGDASFGMLSTMAALQRGEVDVGFIGGAQIDKYGNINSPELATGQSLRPSLILQEAEEQMTWLRAPSACSPLCPKTPKSSSIRLTT